MKSRTKSIVILVLFAIVLLCVGFKVENESIEKQKYTEPTENQFDAKVLEVHDEYLMVEALDNQTIAGEVQVWTGLLSEDEIPKLEEGVIVRITHDGKMTMSLPPQMSAVDEIIIIESE